MQMKKVVILGGGYGGIKLATELQGKADVTVIERNGAFHHNIAALRGVVDENYRWQQFVPYSQNHKFKIIQGEITGMNDKSVLLKDGQNISFDYAVIATGGKNSFPAKIDSYNTIDEAIKKYDEVGEAVKISNNVLIIGGGTVGIELAGEIKSYHPQKSVTIIHNHSSFLSSVQPPYLPELSDAIHKKLTDHGIKVILNDSITSPSLSLPNGWEAGKKELKTEKGLTINADLVFLCVGFKPNSDVFREFLGHSINASGFIKVNEFLQVEGRSNIFALGDVISTAESKQSYIATKVHGPVVYSNIVALIQGKNPSKKHKPGKMSSTLIPIGPNDAVAQIGFLPFGNGVKTSGLLVGLKNSMKLFVPQSWQDIALVKKIPTEKPQQQPAQQFINN